MVCKGQRAAVTFVSSCSFTSFSVTQLFTVHVHARIRGEGTLISVEKHYKNKCVFHTTDGAFIPDLIKVEFLPVQTKEGRMM